MQWLSERHRRIITHSRANQYNCSISGGDAPTRILRLLIIACVIIIVIGIVRSITTLVHTYYSDWFFAFFIYCYRPPALFGMVAESSSHLPSTDILIIATSVSVLPPHTESKDGDCPLEDNLIPFQGEIRSWTPPLWFELVVQLKVQPSFYSSIESLSCSSALFYRYVLKSDRDNLRWLFLRHLQFIFLLLSLHIRVSLIQDFCHTSSITLQSSFSIWNNAFLSAVPPSLAFRTVSRYPHLYSSSQTPEGCEL